MTEKTNNATKRFYAYYNESKDLRRGSSTWLINGVPRAVTEVTEIPKQLPPEGEFFIGMTDSGTAISGNDKLRDKRTITNFKGMNTKFETYNFSRQLSHDIEFNRWNTYTLNDKI